MYDSRTAFWAAAAGMASPGGSVIAFLMTIDAPLVCFWTLALYLFWKALEKKTGGVVEWLGLTAVIGFGLLSKQVMGGFIAAMFVFLVVSRNDRYLLKSYRPYLYSILGLAALVPPVLWNAHHGWTTFYHTAGHFEGSQSIFIATMAEYIGGQVAVISPLTWILFALLCVFLLLRYRSLDRRALYLLCFSCLPLSGVFLLSLRQRIEPNWPAAFYPAAMVLLAAWGCGAVSAGPRPDSRRPLFFKGVIVGAVMALLVYALPFWAGAAPGPWAQGLVSRLQGWRHLGVEAGIALSEVPRPEKTFMLAINNRQLASELAFYMPGQPRVYNWRAHGGLPENQYDIWDGPQTGWDALLVLPGADSTLPAALTGCFREVKKIDSQSPGSGPRLYSFYLGTCITKWPRLAAQGN